MICEGTSWLGGTGSEKRSRLPKDGVTGSGLVLIKGPSIGDDETEALHTSEAKKRCGSKERWIVADAIFLF